MAAKAPLQIRERLAAAVRKYKFRVVCGRGVGQTPPAVDRNAAGCYQPRLWRPTLCCVAGCCAVGLQFLAAPSRWFRVGPPGPRAKRIEGAGANVYWQMCRQLLAPRRFFQIDLKNTVVFFSNQFENNHQTCIKRTIERTIT